MEDNGFMDEGFLVALLVLIIFVSVVFGINCAKSVKEEQKIEQQYNGYVYEAVILDKHEAVGPALVVLGTESKYEITYKVRKRPDGIWKVITDKNVSHYTYNQYTVNNTYYLKDCLISY